MEKKNQFQFHHWFRDAFSLAQFKVCWFKWLAEKKNCPIGFSISYVTECQIDAPSHSADLRLFSFTLVPVSLTNTTGGHLC